MTKEDWQNRIVELREESGSVVSQDVLVAIFYDLLRDHIPCGVLEKIVMENLSCEEKKYLFTNGYLAKYAENLVQKVRDTERS